MSAQLSERRDSGTSAPVSQYLTCLPGLYERLPQVGCRGGSIAQPGDQTSAGESGLQRRAQGGSELTQLPPGPLYDGHHVLTASGDRNGQALGQEELADRLSQTGQGRLRAIGERPREHGQLGRWIHAERPQAVRNLRRSPRSG